VHCNHSESICNNEECKNCTKPVNCDNLVHRDGATRGEVTTEIDPFEAQFTEVIEKLCLCFGRDISTNVATLRSLLGDTATLRFLDLTLRRTLDDR